MLTPAPHVLTMDDAPAILNLFREFLEDEGYRVTTSPVLLDVAEIAALAPDLILLEWHFGSRPDAAWLLMLRLRLEPALSRTPVVLCTTAIRPLTDRHLVQALEHLQVAVVRKPCELDQLLRTVQDALGAPHLRAPHLRVLASPDRPCEVEPATSHPAANQPRPQPVQIVYLSQGGE